MSITFRSGFEKNIVSQTDQFLTTFFTKKGNLKFKEGSPPQIAEFNLCGSHCIDTCMMFILISMSWFLQLIFDGSPNAHPRKKQKHEKQRRAEPGTLQPWTVELNRGNRETVELEPWPTFPRFNRGTVEPEPWRSLDFIRVVLSSSSLPERMSKSVWHSWWGSLEERSPMMNLRFRILALVSHTCVWKVLVTSYARFGHR